MSNKEIVCFTSSFPYGNREVYFETELKYLSENFKHIYIIPLYNPYGTEKKRDIPENVEVLPTMVRQGYHRVIEGIFNFSPLSLLFLKEFFSKKVFSQKIWLINWVNDFLVFRTSHSKFRKIIKKLPEDVVLYSYWANIPVFLSPLCRSYKKIIRMHGGDFYEDRKQGYLTLRKELYERADLLLPISEDIANILREKYNIKNQKISISRLGIKNHWGPVNPAGKPQEIVIVSCSNLHPLKRVSCIPDILKKITKPVTWIHFGDGSEMTAVKQACADLPPNITVDLKGWVSQEELMDFYKNNHVTWFLNVSRYEGLPVSIMEAFSFGIPVIATNVGGTSEIVKKNNGYLIPGNFDPSEVAKQLVETSHNVYSSMKLEAYHMWENNFNADTNYKKLSSIIHNL